MTTVSNSMGLGGVIGPSGVKSSDVSSKALQLAASQASNPSNQLEGSIFGNTSHLSEDIQKLLKPSPGTAPQPSPGTEPQQSTVAAQLQLTEKQNALEGIINRGGLIAQKFPLSGRSSSDSSIPYEPWELNAIDANTLSKLNTFGALIGEDPMATSLLASLVKLPANLLKLVDFEGLHKVVASGKLNEGLTLFLEKLGQSWPGTSVEVDKKEELLQNVTDKDKKDCFFDFIVFSYTFAL